MGSSQWLRYCGIGSYKEDTFVTTYHMSSSPVFTFLLWVEIFPIGIHAPAIIQMLSAFLVTAMETMGDVTATEHASRLCSSGDAYSKRIQRGLLGDTTAMFFAAVATTHLTQPYPKTTVSLPLQDVPQLPLAILVAFGRFVLFWRHCQDWSMDFVHS
jgi:hypothetical protein